MNLNTTVHSALAGVRRHPVRAAAICVPLVVVSVFTGTTMASAGPQARLAVPAAALNAAPAQHVMLFDNDLPSPSASAKEAKPNIGCNAAGCDKDNGRV